MQYRVSEIALEALPSVVKLVLTTLGDGVCLAGGAIRDLISNKSPKDYDLFFFDEKSLAIARKIFHEEGFQTLDINERVETVQKGHIIVDLCYGDMADWQGPVDILEMFDFTCIKACIWQGVLVYHQNFFEDIASKTLRFTGSKYLLDTWYYRIPRYEDVLGYKMSEDDKNKIKQEVIKMGYDPEL